MGRNATTIPVDPRAPDEDAIQRAVSILEDGGIVAYPTETFYGLAVDASSVAACARLFEVKGRPKDKALPCVIASAGELPALARRITPDARVLSERFWPGPLTLVVDARSGLAAASRDGSVAVRVSGLALARRLCRAFGGPLTATSANRTGSPAPTSAVDVRAGLGDTIDLVLDGGVCPGGLPSTIVDVRGDRPALLRSGKIPYDEVQRALISRKS
jgi:L-threonylcarbamoyladenylate synthase